VLFAERVARLERHLARLPGLVVALSGGVDSGALLGAAARAVRGPLVAVTARSPAVPDAEVALAARVARRLGVPHVVARTAELSDPAYRANAGDRCYFCRREMYGVFLGVAAARGIAAVADGLQADDDADGRAGVRAAGEAGILHPLRECGLGKADARRLARAWGLPVHDRPAEPCLASRLPVGVAVTVDRLRRVRRAEEAVRALGFREVRVRCEDRHARIEVGAAELARASGRSEELVAAALRAGFESAALDPQGYRSGGAGGLREGA